MLLALPSVASILHGLGEGPRQQAELRLELGSPAQTTLRTQLRRLEEIGAVGKQRQNRFPGVLEYELTAAGRELLCVAGTTQRWLDAAPRGPLQLGEPAAKAAVKALVDAWSTTMLRALAANPLSLTQLDRLISSISYPSLERRLAALRMAEQARTRESNGRGTPYELTAWGRAGAGPLAAAVRWERRHSLCETAPLERIDAETLFLLGTPLVDLGEDASGTCRMAIELPAKERSRLAGVMVDVRDGRVVSCTSRLQGNPDAWALGSPLAWLDALVTCDRDRLEMGGDGRFAGATLDALHRELFGSNGVAAPAGGNGRHPDP